MVLRRAYAGYPLKDPSFDPRICQPGCVCVKLTERLPSFINVTPDTGGCRGPPCEGRTTLCSLSLQKAIGQTMPVNPKTDPLLQPQPRQLKQKAPRSTTTRTLDQGRTTIVGCGPNCKCLHGSCVETTPGKCIVAGLPCQEQQPNILRDIVNGIQTGITRISEGRNVFTGEPVFPTRTTEAPIEVVP